MKGRIAGLLLAALLAVPASADYGGGCPVSVIVGMKLFKDAQGQPIPHDGQWFTANYPGSVCGASEVDVIWSVQPSAHITTDTCLSPIDFVVTLEGGDKTCSREHGKIFWIKEPGVYNVTATSPAGGSWTAEGVVVD